MAGNVEMEQDAAEIRLRAKRRFGEMQQELREAGTLRSGRPAKNGTKIEPNASRVHLADLGVTKRFSSEAQQSAGIAERAFEAMVGRIREQIAARGDRVALNTEEKKQRRAVRERVLAGVICALPTQKAGVILEDFEWHHDVWSEGGMDRHAANHYETARAALTPEAIVERTRDRFEIAHTDCVLFMWATNQHLWIALQVMALRGFSYVSNYAWGKDKIGMGYWGREKHELLLIGVKGNVPCPAPGTQWESLIVAPRGEHSEKPEEFYRMIETYFPTLPKVELNARKVRPGWIGWGNQYPVQAEAAE